MPCQRGQGRREEPLVAEVAGLEDDQHGAGAAANADWKSAPGFGILLTDQPGDKSWPVTGAAFILMYKKQDKPERAQQVLDFFDWAYKSGDKLAMELDYVPMPASVVKQIEAAWASEIKGADGKPVWKLTQ